MSKPKPTIYSETLRAYLDRNSARQADIADAANVSQAAISRYAVGWRFPDRATAEKIATATDGEVSVELWAAVAAKRFGLAA